MTAATDLLIGEFARTLDERFRLAIPPELAAPLLVSGSRLMLAKERAGCLSLWPAAVWKPRIDAAVDVVRTKLQAGLLTQRVGQVQQQIQVLAAESRSIDEQTRQLNGRRDKLAGERQGLARPDHDRIDQLKRDADAAQAASRGRTVQARIALRAAIGGAS